MLRIEKSNASVMSAAFGMGLLLLATCGCAKKSVSDMNCVEYFRFATDTPAGKEALERMGSGYEAGVVDRLERMDASGETAACKESVKEVFGGDPLSPLERSPGQ